MPFDTQAVAFEIPDVNMGFKKATGLVNLSGEELVLEFQEEDAFIGVFQSDVKEVRIPLDQLQEIRFKKGWFSSKLILEARSLKVFRELPGSGHKVTLKIKRGDRKDADRLISKIRLAKSEQQLRDLDVE